MNDIETVIRKYLETFNITDDGRRRAAIDALYAERCHYTDPHVALVGREQVDAFIAGVQKKYPGVVFRLGGPVDAHHDQARFTWHAGPKDAAPLAIGFDVVVLEDGRIRDVFGFYDQLPG